MHVPDGVLSVPVLTAGAVATAAGVGWAIRTLDAENLPRVAVMSAMFFACSLIAIPVGPASVHLLLGGLMGLVLGRAIFAAVFVALVLQAVFLGFGGLTTLGVTTLNIALPGLVFGLLARPWLARAGDSPARAGAVGAATASLCVLASVTMLALCLLLSDPAYGVSAQILLAANIPLLAAETAVTGMAVAFLMRVKPELIAETVPHHA